MTTITPQVLLKAYTAGVFPMAESADDPALYWIEPDERGVIPLDRFHVSASLRKVVRHGGFETRVDSAFDEVIRACAEKTETRDVTWINHRVVKLYQQLHKMGCCHSVESWLDGQLVGGLYGVDAGGIFCGESMFHHEDNASKLAILFLASHLRARGSAWMDIQQLTPHMARLGAREVMRSFFLEKLAREIAAGKELFNPSQGTS